LGEGFDLKHYPLFLLVMQGFYQNAEFVKVLVLSKRGAKKTVSGFTCLPPKSSKYEVVTARSLHL